MEINVLILPATVSVPKSPVKRFVFCARLRQVRPPGAPDGRVARRHCDAPDRNSLPDETVKLALDADATLMGAVGLPEFDNVATERRPEKGLLGIRKVLGVYANLRPVKTYRALVDSSSLKNHLVEART